MAEINREDDPSYFKHSREEFDYGVVCGCGWYNIGMSYYKKEVLHSLDIHQERFCRRRKVLQEEKVKTQEEKVKTTVLAFDPGGTTGWALFRADEMQNPDTGELEYYNWDFSCGQLSANEHHLILDNFLALQQTEKTIVVFEAFEYRNQSRAGLNLMSREYIGVIKRFCQERGIQHYKVNASMAKGFVRDVHLKKLGLWYSANKHAMDANRHLINFLINGEGWKEGYMAKRLLERAYK